MKVYIIIILLSVSLITLTCNIREDDIAKADFPYYSTEEDAIQASNLIIFGKVISVKSEQLNISNNDEEVIAMYSVSDIEVTEVIKGDCKVGDIVQVKQIGESGDNSIKDVEKYGYFKEKDEKIFFLVGFDSVPYSTLNPNQGHINIIKDKILTNDDSKLFKKFNRNKKEDLIEHIKSEL